LEVVAVDLYRLTRLAVAVVSALSVFLFIPAAASAAPPATNKVSRSPAATTSYQIYPGSTNASCLNVKGGSKSNDVAIILYRCINPVPADEQWVFKYFSSVDAYEISSVSDNKCLNIPNATYADNVQIVQYDCSGSYLTYWDKWIAFPMPPAYPNYYQLQSLGDSSYCLNIKGNLVNDGTSLVLYKCTNAGFGGAPNDRFTWN
jgi:hypothetical protein